jgi:hypothetical protein
LEYFVKIAPYLGNPLVLVGFGLMLVFGIHQALLKSGLLAKITSKETAGVLRLLVHYGFVIAVLLMFAGFGLAFVKQLQLRPEPAAIQTPDLPPVPSFALEAPTVHTDSGDWLQISLVNHAGEAENTQIDCFAFAQIWLAPPSNKEGLKLNTGQYNGAEQSYYLSCNRFTSSRYDPNLSRPVFNDVEADRALAGIPALASPASARIYIEAWFHVAYDDAAGTHKNQYFHLKAERQADEEPTVSIIGPTEFETAKQSYLAARWPCNALSTNQCSKKLFDIVGGDATPDEFKLRRLADLLGEEH